jgi:acyl-CoA reductase-like NAD-dependent aldehyde dehydrogenase
MGAGVATEALPTRLFINGEQLEAAEGSTHDVVNPATEEVIASVAAAGAKDVDRAVLGARATFESDKWRKMSARQRGEAVWRLGELILKHKEELARLETLNNGKPVFESMIDVRLAAATYKYYGGWADKIHGETIPVDGPFLNYTLREPLGVVGAIVPWNFPISLAAWKIAPALACGNTVVLKPAELTPFTAIRMAELAIEAGLPPGAFNCVPGPGSVAGMALVRHPEVDKIAFTGSTEVGKQIMREAAGTVKKVSLELGGKSPNIVYADADIERFASESPYSVFDNCGQDCCARSRIFVERSVHEKVVELFVEATKKVKVGDPADDATEVGSLVSFKQRDRVKDYIEIGLGEGANLVVGGDAPDDPALKDGAFLMPAVFDNVSNDMRVAKEEIFGPVVSVIPFDTEAEAIRLANATPYGLSGSVWSRDIGKALRTARGIQAGVLSVNSNSSVHTEAPFGGYKMSGIGRELGMSAIDLYTETKNIFIDLK